MSGRIVLTGCLLATLLACTTTPEAISRAPAGSLLVDVYPNPIVATVVGPGLYEFPFEVSLREVGGVAVDIDGIRVEVRLKGLPLFTQIFDGTELTRRGYAAHIPASGNVQYRFAPRREVPTDLIFSQVSAEVAISAVDQRGKRTEAKTVVTVRR